MKIAFYETEQWEENILQKEFPDSSFPKKIGGDFDIVSIFIKTTVDASFLDAFPSLKYIITRSAGFDHIDLNLCKKRNITVSYVPCYGKNTVAEFAFALILALSRKVIPSYETVKKTQTFTTNKMTGFDLRGKIIGIIGTGNIGECFIKIAQGFGMTIIGNDIKETLAIDYLPLEELLKKSDIVSLHVPYNKSTHHLLNKNTFSLMKTGSYLINTSRGNVVDTKALLDALNAGHLAGAGLDVIENEKDLSSPINQKIINHPHTIVTPHNAYNTIEALHRILETTILNIKNFINGKPSDLVQK